MPCAPTVMVYVRPMVERAAAKICAALYHADACPLHGARRATGDGRRRGDRGHTSVSVRLRLPLARLALRAAHSCADSNCAALFVQLTGSQQQSGRLGTICQVHVTTCCLSARTPCSPQPACSQPRHSSYGGPGCSRAQALGSLRTSQRAGGATALRSVFKRASLGGTRCYHHR